MSLGLSVQTSRAGWISLVASARTLMSGEAVARLLGFATVFVLARSLEPGGFGLVTLGTTIVAFLVIFVDSGTELINVRDIAREPQRFKEIVEPVLGLRLALSIPSAALLAIVVLVAAKAGADRIALGLFALVLPMTALNLRWMALGVGASKAIAISKVARELIVLGGVLLWVNRSHDATIVAVLFAAGEFVGAAVVLDAARRRFGFVRPRVNTTFWRTSMRASRPILVNTVARATVYTFDVVLIAALLGRAPVGLYTAAYKPVLLGVTVLAIFFVSFLASYSAAEGEDAAQLFRRTVAIVLGGAVPAALVLSLGASVFCDLAYGGAYGGAATALAIVVWSLPILAISGAYANVLIAGNRPDSLMAINIVGAVVNVIANVVAVPLAGIAGAAAVTVGSELLVMSLTARAVVRYELERSPIAILKSFVRWHRPKRLEQADR
jgi:O-antigen/teichoic acid export membrane protein